MFLTNLSPILLRLYGLTVTPLGPYSGDLNNKGEKVELINVPGGNVVVYVKPNPFTSF